ncbi:DUF2141 domain-containing protein [Psychroflexus sp. ALD_RP9]|uniref:DUF2141 domain-containing protein n=1 Tax=Psychroflexus sp. ALD_RP9 TaxID=2777186 RepID=UPI001A9073A4|nr:DUF2141 domain-containing protein [Psychroflexus sp. ALD_RP9]QSS96841.1 DUF2141 domain-containing protein [Psychroflexus sp. ALD_RP9]
MRNLIILSIVFLSQLLSAQDNRLSIEVKGISELKGKIYVGVFTEDNFLRGKPIYGEIVEVEAETEIVNLVDIPTGNYAVSVYQDLNNNEVFDMDEYGRPTEPWAMSGTNPKNQQPVWDLAMFKLGKKSKTITVNF